MRRSERYGLPAVIAVCAAVLIAFFVLHGNDEAAERGNIRIGLILNGDESTAYSENFIQSMARAAEQFGDRTETIVKKNVPAQSAGRVIDELVDGGCNMIVTSSYDYETAAIEAAGTYPGIEFFQATGDNANGTESGDNYHTFMGRIYEARYVSGLVAGRKLAELIADGTISGKEAVVGYVGAYSCPEVISGFTAFYLGVKAECPEAVMKVRYTDTWGDYRKEYDTASELIDEGCVIISQHSDTAGPAAACERARLSHTVFHVGYNQNMTGTAPRTSLISSRIDWTPYLKAAVESVLEGRKVEDVLDAKTDGNDAQAGFDKGWVKMLPLNDPIAAEGTQELIDETIEKFENGEMHVFSGNYTGQDPDNPDDVIDLKTEYKENENASAPSFHYILDGITVEDEN